MTKIEHIEAEILKARERIAEQQAKIRTLEGQKIDEENALIVQMVRKQRMTPADLARFLDRHKNTLTNPNKTPSVFPAIIKKRKRGKPLMKTKIKHSRLVAAILSFVFLFCATMPFTAYAAPEDETTSPGTEATTPAENEVPAENNPPAENEKKAPDGATPPYYATGNIIENIRQNGAEDTGLQFVIFKTDTDKIFYLVIDYDKSSDNVFLLTEVGENDLLNFVEIDENGNIIDPPPGNNGGSQQNPGQQNPEAPEKNSNTGLIVLIIVVVGIGGAAFYFFKAKKGKNKPLKAADFDLDDEDEYEDEPTVNEDGADEE